MYFPETKSHVNELWSASPPPTCAVESSLSAATRSALRSFSGTNSESPTDASCNKLNVLQAGIFSAHEADRFWLVPSRSGAEKFSRTSRVGLCVLPSSRSDTLHRDEAQHFSSIFQLLSQEKHLV